jgi:hypothetical protein
MNHLAFVALFKTCPNKYEACFVSCHLSSYVACQILVDRSLNSKGQSRTSLCSSDRVIFGGSGVVLIRFFFNTFRFLAAARHYFFPVSSYCNFMTRNEVYFFQFPH